MTQTFTDDQIEQLSSKLSTTAIRERKGGAGKMLKYIKGDYAIDTANRIFGFGQWGYKTVARSREAVRDDKKGTIEYYSCDVELSVVGAAFTFPGSGVGIVTAPFTVEMHEKARKEAETDALKRALRHYGDQFGLSLYDEDDYLENPDGTITQVRNARPVQQAPQQRVVNAAPARQQIAAPVDARPAPGQSIANDIINTGQIAGIRNMCAALGRIVPDDLETLTSLKAAQLIRDLTTAYNKAKQDKTLPTPNPVEPAYLKPSEVDALKAEWARICDVKEADIERRFSSFLVYINDGKPLSSDRVTRAHAKTAQEYLDKQSVKVS